MRFGSGGKQARVVSAELAAGLVKSGDWVDYAFTFSQPDLFDKALAARVGLPDRPQQVSSVLQAAQAAQAEQVMPEA